MYLEIHKMRIPSPLQTSLIINDLTKSGTKSGTNVPDFLFLDIFFANIYLLPPNLLQNFLFSG